MCDMIIMYSFEDSTHPRVFGWVIVDAIRVQENQCLSTWSLSDSVRRRQRLSELCGSNYILRIISFELVRMVAVNEIVQICGISSKAGWEYAAAYWVLTAYARMINKVITIHYIHIVDATFQTHAVINMFQLVGIINPILFWNTHVIDVPKTHNHSLIYISCGIFKYNCQQTELVEL